MAVSFVSLPGSGQVPNEDAIAATADVVAVVDGVSTARPAIASTTSCFLTPPSRSGPSRRDAYGSAGAAGDEVADAAVGEADAHVDGLAQEGRLPVHPHGQSVVGEPVARAVRGPSGRPGGGGPRVTTSALR